jgi:nucleotide-binding universal stress UspA family protein
MVQEKPMVVMVAVDGSKPAEVAMNAAIDFAKEANTRVIIVYVHSHSSAPLLPGIPPYPNILTDLGASSPRVPKEIINKMQPILLGYEEKAKAAGIKDVESKILPVWDSVGGGLVQETKRYNATILFVGSRGMTGLKRAFIGSVADYVVRNSECDVYIAR